MKDNGYTVLSPTHKIPDISAENGATAREIDKIRVAKNKPQKKGKNTKLDKVKQKTEVRKVSKSTQDTLPYVCFCSEYIMCVDKNRFSKTYKFDDVNYTSASAEQQEAIFLAYCDVLNGIDTTADLQVTIHNNKVNRRDFERKILLKPKNDNFNKYREEYNEMLREKLMQGQNGISCNKYMTLTVTAVDVEAAAQKIATIEVHLRMGFQKIGSSLIPLNANQRVRILADIFRGVNKEIRPISTGEFQRRSEKSLCCPDYFEFKNDYFMYDNNYARLLFVRQLPSSLADTILTNIAETNLNLIVTVNIAAVEPDAAIKIVNRQLTSMRSDQIKKNKKASQHGVFIDVTSDNLKRSLEEAEGLLDDLTSKNQKMFLTNLIVMVIADNFNELEANTEKIIAVLNKNVCTTATAFLQQEECLASVLPIGNCKLDVRRTLITESTAVFMPFNARELTQEGGMYYGLNSVNNNIIIFNRTNLINPNGFILGAPGSGKSFSAKREMLNVFLCSDDDIIIIDPEREYTNLCRALNGEVIYISENSKSYLNPLEIVLTDENDDDPVAAKYNFFLSFFETIMGKSGITPEQKTAIDNCLHRIYNPILAGQTDVMPTLSDYFKVLGEYAEEKPEAKSLYSALELYVTGSMSTFAHSSNVNTNNRVVVYDIKELGKQLKSLGMMVVLENLWDRIVRNRLIGRRTRIYIDEIYLLFQNEQSANFLYELYKRARKWGGIPTGITQNVEDLLRSDTGRSMLANSEFILMLSQSATDRDNLAKLLKIPEESMTHVTNAIAGSGLMFAGSYGITPFKDDFPQNTELYKLMTTRFGEADNSEGRKNEGNSDRNTA